MELMSLPFREQMKSFKYLKIENSLLKRLLAESFGEEIWKELISSDPDLATRLSLQECKRIVLEP